MDGAVAANIAGVGAVRRKPPNPTFSTSSTACAVPLVLALVLGRCVNRTVPLTQAEFILPKDVF